MPQYHNDHRGSLLYGGQLGSRLEGRSPEGSLLGVSSFTCRSLSTSIDALENQSNVLWKTFSFGGRVVEIQFKIFCQRFVTSFFWRCSHMWRLQVSCNSAPSSSSHHINIGCYDVIIVASHVIIISSSCHYHTIIISSWPSSNHSKHIREEIISERNFSIQAEVPSPRDCQIHPAQGGHLHLNHHYTLKFLFPDIWVKHEYWYLYASSQKQRQNVEKTQHMLYILKSNILYMTFWQVNWSIF